MISRNSITFTANGIVSAIRMPVTVKTADKQIKIMAVWDTGAMGTCVSERVAEILQLVPISKSLHNTANGPAECNDYIINIRLLDSIEIEDVRVSDFKGDAEIDALIGMDIITMGDMAITNARGKTVMSYRIPPDVDHIDYVKMQNRDNEKKDAIKNYKKKLKKHQL